MNAPRFQSRRCDARGFTLLELLIGTAVGAVVLLVVQTTYFGALKLHNSTHDRIKEDLGLQRALAIIRRDLAGIMLPGGTLSGELQTTTFTSSFEGNFGDRVSPDLYTNSGRIDGWNPFSEVQMVSFYLSPSTDGSSGKRLLRIITRNLLPVQEQEPEEQLLLTGVESAEMLFFDGMSWTDNWDSTETSTLPQGIRFSLVLAAQPGVAAAREPIDLVVPVMVVTTTSQQQAEEEAMP
ncbi:MAG: prepilin-type N-terminal cleavage/methylation domain-containing protein [Verrucomicrobia bacterium]|nr:prepilin-type N-terminal cleavage/methylation domain-containing protein [Verrucomicrobiota bacterium]